MNKCCCRYCGNHKAGCHSTCAEYTAYKEFIEQRKEAQSKEDSALMVTYNKKKRIIKFLKRCGIKK